MDRDKIAVLRELQKNNVQLSTSYAQFVDR